LRSYSLCFCTYVELGHVSEGQKIISVGLSSSQIHAPSLADCAPCPGHAHIIVHRTASFASPTLPPPPPTPQAGRTLIVPALEEGAAGGAVAAAAHCLDGEVRTQSGCASAGPRSRRMYAWGRARMGRRSALSAQALAAARCPRQMPIKVARDDAAQVLGALGGAAVATAASLTDLLCCAVAPVADAQATSPWSLCALYDALPEGVFALTGPTGADYESEPVWRQRAYVVKVSTCCDERDCVGGAAAGAALSLAASASAYE
jgi:hypothetical protein